MTKTFRASGREYQRSHIGSPDGALSNPLARESRATGEFRISSELERGRFFDPTFNAFSSATHEGRLITFYEGTPPAVSSVSHGTEHEKYWTYRITQVIGTDEIVLEGFRAQFAGTGISYVIHAAADFTAATAGNFPQDTGPTGTDADGVERSNTGPCEWQALFFPTAVDPRLKAYPMWVTRRTSSTVLRISDPYDNFSTMPTETNLQWHLRDRPAYTHDQLYKIVHQFYLHCGWEAHQHRGKNNGPGNGGDFNNTVYCVDDWIYRSTGENDDTVMFMRWAAFHKSSETTHQQVGSDSQGVFGFDIAMWSAWDRDYASVSIPGAAGGTTANPGNGVNSLSSHNSSNNNNEWAAQADTPNTTANSEPGYAPDSTDSAGEMGSAFWFRARWNNEFHNSSSNDDLGLPIRRFIGNALNTPAGGDIAEVKYVLFGDKDELHVYFYSPGFGTSYKAFGGLTPRADANPARFTTNFVSEAGPSQLVHIGGPGTADGTDPTSLTPPYAIGDRLQMVGQTVRAGLSPGVSHAGEFVQSSTITDLPGLVAARGILLCDDPANISDGWTFVLDDGTNPPVTFEYDKNGSVVESATLRQVDISAAGDGDDVRDAIVSAVTGAPTLDITATGTITARVDLINDNVGGAGNVDIIDTNNSFLEGTTGMGGGGYAFEVANVDDEIREGALVGEDPQPMFIYNHSSDFDITDQGIFRVSNRSNFGDATYRDWNGPSGTPPNSCGFDCLAQIEGVQTFDMNQMNPNERTGRFVAAPISCVDTVGGQVRGLMRYARFVHGAVGTWDLKRDRNGNWHLIIPSGNRNAGVTTFSQEQLQIAIGPMTNAMAFVG